MLNSGKKTLLCKTCKKPYRNKESLRKHQLQHLSSIATKTTLRPTTRLPARFIEAKDVIPITSPVINYKILRRGHHPYACNKCNKDFTTKENLEKHRSFHVEIKTPKPKKKRFTCEVCAKDFVKQCDLLRHMRSHTGEKPCECHICHKRFQQAHNLKKHLKSHFNIKAYECAICDKNFTRNDSLTRHLLIHADVKPFTCKVCNKSFIRPAQLEQHGRRHLHRTK